MLPADLRFWPADALEEWRERAALIHEGCNGEEWQWPAAKEAAERVVRARWLTPPCHP